MVENSGARSMKGQGIHPFLPFNCINANHRRLARKFDHRDNNIELGRIEIAFELLA